ncbi:hypothetical protein [uncultured Gammaproteobacteria bacterium]|nr:hypothetical protein BROOK1789C_464 [Bathymodiolus brooksi thiotrophic gill symbiont]CAC9597262.1 hypothetical protein [uncultured Gammaproteobacteria bacterium]CAC9610051.1 hypothetical protein [uncultured Gammaproteobacteria bacterium]CAC9971782.1 hypothetical protein [uncultured Gammaproteobacteria bacterium]
MQKSYEKGIVLVSILIIVAMISLVVNLMWQQQALTLKNTAHSIDAQKAISYLYGMESWVTSILKQDDDKIDELDEDWARIIPPIPVPNGIIEGKIFDLQAQFNINQLFYTERKDRQVYIKAGYKDFLNILNTTLDQDYMSDSILDHMNASRPLLSKFEHISQLKSVEGISLENYLKIKPYLYAYENIKAKVNINTASKEVIAALYPDLVDKIIGDRPFESLANANQTILQLPTGANSVEAKKKFTELVSINSNYFLLKADIDINDTHLQAQTLFHRQGKTINIVERTYRQILE